MSVLKRLQQSKAPVVLGIGASAGLIIAAALGGFVINEQQKRIEELERKVDHIIDDIQK